jgi:hypothetical protein
MNLLETPLLTFAIFIPLAIILVTLSRQIFQGQMRNAGYAFAVVSALMASSLLSTPLVWTIFSAIATVLLLLFIGLFVLVGVANLRYRLNSYRIRSRFEREYARNLLGRRFRFDRVSGEFEEVD